MPRAGVGMLSLDRSSRIDPEGESDGVEPSRHAAPPRRWRRRRGAGVSRQTVSNALNSPDLLRPDTLARVQQAIDELGYSPNRAARNLRTRSSHLIGLRVDPAVGGQRQRR